MDQKPIISVKEARKLLDKTAKGMDDEQIAELVEQTHDLAKLALEVAKDKIARGKRSDENSQDKLNGTLE